jgi:hypothetical protein
MSGASFHKNFNRQGHKVTQSFGFLITGAMASLRYPVNAVALG